MGGGKKRAFILKQKCLILSFISLALKKMLRLKKKSTVLLFSSLIS